MTPTVILDLQEAESRRRVIQARIDAEMSADERNRTGQFATPPDLAVSIARHAKRLMEGWRESIHFCDPALGTGAFFYALLSVFPRQRIASAIGIEILPELAKAARDLWGSFGLRVVRGHFTEPATISGLQRPNLVLTNPPYVRHHHLSKDQKSGLQREVWRTAGLQVNGLSGFYVYYLILASAWMEDGGLAAWLIPSEFMDVNYGHLLRDYLTERVTLLRLHRFDPDDVQFRDALVTSAVVFFRKAQPEAGVTATLSYGGALAEPELWQEVPLSTLRRAEKWTRYPMPRPKRDHQAGRVARQDIRLGDLFTIRRGIATGANEFFILPRVEAAALGLPSEFLKPILPSPRDLQQTVIGGDANGYPLTEPQLVVIDCDLPESEIRRRYPALWSYLRKGERLGIRERYLPRHRSAWYKQEERASAPYLCTYMGRRKKNGKAAFRFIWNRSRAIATNLYLMLYPMKPVEEALKAEPELEAALFDMLSGITSEDLMRAGRVYGGGLRKLEPGELSDLSVGAFLEQIPRLKETLRPQLELEVAD